ncbi:hypothetical protein [Undibacterium flavidum]|uniref:Uncharacterized protein n=1 Tax=Undibacterium flavidum TaxID=2762297 RepID=A0ABR6YDH8_9BURK|nr:hypothetical protein [Undibacterium flavidum]MBC3874606.1 hypothetical protein [Undibacterium flavidum]
MIEFSKLDPHEKRIVWKLSETIGTTTPILFASINHTGELWAASEILKLTPNKDSETHKRVCTALKRGSTKGENVLDIIKELHPEYALFETCFDCELEDLLPESKVATEVH